MAMSGSNGQQMMMTKGRVGCVVALLLLLSCSNCNAWLWKKKAPEPALADPIIKTQDTEAFIGWQGEKAAADENLAYVDLGSPRSTPSGPGWIETLSWEPRAFVYHNFLSAAECDHLISLARPFLERSGVVDSDTGKIITSGERTSSGVFLDREQDEVVAEIERRLADFSKLPLQNGEPLHILRYQDGEEYRPHFDYFFDEVHVKNGGQRVATVLMYLTDVEEGGETVFPDSVNKPPEEIKHKYSTCAQAGVAVKAKRGDALLFFSLTPAGEKDALSLHAGCPVTKGVKFSATKWIRVDEHSVWNGYAARKAELEAGKA